VIDMRAANHSVTTNVLEWAIQRLKVYVIAALAAPALLLAGTAFYTYVWPGVAKHDVAPRAPSTGPPPMTSATPPMAPAVAPIVVPDPAPADRAAEVASAQPEIPPESKLVGARIIDQNKHMVGFVTHVRRDERGKVAKVGVRLDATQQESDVPLADMRWSWDSEPGTKATGLWIMKVPENRR
jgi:hypothetical protein